VLSLICQIGFVVFVILHLVASDSFRMEAWTIEDSNLY